MFHRLKPEEQQEKQQEMQVEPQQEKIMPKETAVTSKKIESEKTTQAKEEVIMNRDQSDNRGSEGHSKEFGSKETSSMEAPSTMPFQRPSQMQRSMPGGFSAGTYPGAAAQSYDSNNGENSRLVIGRGITMSGEIEACDYLLVEGTLEAALKGARVLEIAETGVFYGAVEIEEATVAGRFEGDLTVNGRLTIKEGGSVTGSVAYKELAIEAGAVLDGKVSPLAAMGAAMAADDAPKSTKSMAPKNDNAGEDNRAELPFSGGAVAAAE